MITLRDGIIGVMALVVLSAVSIAVAALLGTVEAGDILSFEGALVGAAGAVWGALYVESRKRRLSELEEQQPIFDALDAVRRTVPTGNRGSDFPGSHYDDVRSALTILDEIYAFYPPKRPVILIARRHFKKVVDEYLVGLIPYLGHMARHQQDVAPMSIVEGRDAFLEAIKELRRLHAKTS